MKLLVDLILVFLFFNHLNRGEIILMAIREVIDLEEII